MRRPRPHVSQLAKQPPGVSRSGSRSRGRDAPDARDPPDSGLRRPWAFCVIQSARAWTVDGVWLGC